MMLPLRAHEGGRTHSKGACLLLTSMQTSIVTVSSSEMELGLHGVKPGQTWGMNAAAAVHTLMPASQGRAQSSRKPDKTTTREVWGSRVSTSSFEGKNHRVQLYDSNTVE